ncbi:SA1788 family PVL leukocidin-associated protein [Staphylococcus pasteuri]|uniref:SA1788 family PVL leukocidin-associated protein n=1 Tax=Staphylococcus pasteuri TaxID=45972 RepID=UPI000E3A7FC9|nr:SA1788 family PVL leukocidin-associated protein [Staphylococcus pasteuri]MEB7433319.1 hypothetical protein [Staphylococcus pasteuri]RFD69590.1 hypothetical protein A7974_03740 [Staphylococcus pasteuri]
MKDIKITVKGRTYFITPFEQDKMENNRVSMQLLRQRLDLGWTYHDAIDAPRGMHKKIYEEHKKIRKYDSDYIAEKIRQDKEKRKQKRKPHLFNVPQKHHRGKWCSYLMENDIFPKVVK